MTITTETTSTEIETPVVTGSAVTIPAGLSKALEGVISGVAAIESAEGRALSAQTALMIHLAAAANVQTLKPATIADTLCAGRTIGKRLAAQINTATRAATRIDNHNKEAEISLGKSHAAAVKTLTAALGDATATDVIALSKTEIDANVIGLAITADGEAATAAREAIASAKQRANVKAKADAEARRVAKDLAKAGGSQPAGPDAPKKETVEERQIKDVAPVAADLQAIANTIGTLNLGEVRQLVILLSDTIDNDAWNTIAAAMDDVATEWEAAAETAEAEAAADDLAESA